MSEISQLFNNLITLLSQQSDDRFELKDDMIKAKYSISDFVYFKTRELGVGKVEEVNDDNIPTYKVRVFEYDEAIKDYKPTSGVEEDVTESELSTFSKSKQDSEVGDILKFNNGYGEVVYRTEEQVVLREYDKDGKLRYSSERVHVSDMYDMDSYPEATIEYKFEDIVFQKQTDGTMTVFGIYSSHYIDSDKEILTAESHKKFAKGVNDGEYEYPDIYIAHIPLTVGKCEMIDYHTDGFAVFGGRISKEWVDTVEQIVKGSLEHGIKLGLSHGFSAKSVEYDEAGDITKYISKEVSILPVDGWFNKDGEKIRIVGASNKYTALLTE